MKNLKQELVKEINANVELTASHIAVIDEAIAKINEMNGEHVVITWEANYISNSRRPGEEPKAEYFGGSIYSDDNMEYLDIYGYKKLDRQVFRFEDNSIECSITVAILNDDWYEKIEQYVNAENGLMETLNLEDTPENHTKIRHTLIENLWLA